MRPARRRRWDEYSPAQRALFVVVASVQVSLAVSAWRTWRDAPRIRSNGRKRTWAVVIALNFIGPLLYFRRGRADAPEHRASLRRVPVHPPEDDLVDGGGLGNSSVARAAL